VSSKDSLIMADDGAMFGTPMYNYGTPHSPGCISEQKMTVVMLYPGEMLFEDVCVYCLPARSAKKSLLIQLLALAQLLASACSFSF
jgi:hypothetical protein